MPNEMTGYEARVADITSRAHQIRASMLDPVLDDKGGIIANPKDRQERLKNAVRNSVFESLGFWSCSGMSQPVLSGIKITLWAL